MSDSTKDVANVTRRRARSGVGYATADVTVHETRSRRILLRPWYIHHNTRPDELAVKLISQVPAAGGGWTQESELNLDEEAVARLRTELEAHTEVARASEEGEFLLIRAGGLARTSEAGPGELVRAVLQLLSRRDVLDRFAHEDLGEHILSALQGSIRLQELRTAVAQLREMLDAGVVDEQPYQEWCTRHSWAFGNAHTVPDDIRRVSRTDDVDILMPRVLTGYRDIVELKRPDHEVLVRDRSRGTVYWSSDASQAIGQGAEYIEHLAADAEHGLRGRPEIVTSQPRATIVIGRSSNWTDAHYRILARLSSHLVGITVMTYDQLLAQGDELIRLFGAS
jgi:antiviral defense system Shedu protein SduA